MAQSRKRKYQVSGINEEGDVWTFSTDDKERVEVIKDDMVEDLDDVQLNELS